MKKPNTGNNNQYYCINCMYCYDSKEKRDTHTINCLNVKDIPSLDIYPKKGKNDKMKFDKIK